MNPVIWTVFVNTDSTESSQKLMDLLQSIIKTFNETGKFPTLVGETTTKPLYQAKVLYPVAVRDQNGKSLGEIVSTGIVVDVWAEGNVPGFTNRAYIVPQNSVVAKNVVKSGLSRL